MTKEGDEHIKWFSELGKEDVKTVGGKGANLGEMTKLGLPIPPGFCILTSGYLHFLRNTDLEIEIYNILNRLDVEHTQELEQASVKINKMIIEAEMPKKLEEEILDNYEALNLDVESFGKASGQALSILKKAYEPIFVAVRSSATAEDSSEASFAGQQETFLNIKGKTQVIEAVKKCWASLFTARSIYYRIKKGFKHEQVLISVVIMKMINSEKSGVIFTKNPVGENENIVIEAVYGLGEGIVSGMISPDHYEISKDYELVEKRISNKKIAMTRNSGGENKVVNLSEEKAHSQVLSETEIKKLAKYSIKLEEHYKKPQDIEFAIDSEDIFIVQTRPITTLSLKQKSQEISGKEILKGVAASPGIGSGVVRIVRTLQDLEKIRKGDILVTKMTNPDMVVTMQKSAAIITDEGGLTCFSGDTKVLTDKGFITIRDAHEMIKDNQKLILLAYDSKEMKPKWKRVLSSGKRRLKTIRVSCSQTGKIEDNFIDLTENHKMITFKNRNLIKKPVSDILSQEEMICLIDKMPYIGMFSDYKKAYLLGALLSDGYFKVEMYHTGNPRRGRITFTQKETPEKEEFINIVKEYYKEVFNEEFRAIPFCSVSNLRGRQISGEATHFSSYKLAPAMEIARISQNLDGWALRLDETSSLNFLAGLIDGDGSFLDNRLHIYVSKENILQGVILSCLNLGIFPQVTKNRGIHHVQILERMSDILTFTKRARGIAREKVLGNKLFSAKQILGDIIDKVNWQGKIKTYVNNNLLIDSRKLCRLFKLCDEKTREEIIKVINSGLRMHRVNKISDLYEEDVFNLEIEADNELDHNFIVFTKKYTPLLVSNSHAAIVSREMGIPAVIGTERATNILKDGQELTVNGFTGKIYEGKHEKVESEILPIIQTETKIKVIVDLPDYAERAAKTEANCVGLTRIEGIIAESGKHPLYFYKENKMKDYENIIFKGIHGIAKHFDEVWVRTSDIRTDEYKNLQGAPKEVEVNPMLGYHGIRFSLKKPEILKAELLALKRAAEDSKKRIGIMLPQVVSVEEVKETKQILKEINFSSAKLGVMIETPAAVQIIEELCKEGIEFISFGTNDLTQYTLAIDRGNEHIQYLYNEMHPAVLSQIASVIEVCKKHNVETSICGQAASTKEMAEFLVSRGIDSISVNADKAQEISMLVHELESKDLRGSESQKNQQEDNMAKKNQSKILEIDDTKHLEEKIEKKQESVKQENQERDKEWKENEDSIEVEEKTEEEIEKEEKEKKDKEKKSEEFPEVDIGIDIFAQQ